MGTTKLVAAESAKAFEGSISDHRMRLGEEWVAVYPPSMRLGEEWVAVYPPSGIVDALVGGPTSKSATKARRRQRFGRSLLTKLKIMW